MIVNNDQYYMDIAKSVANGSTCLRRKVGATLLKDGSGIASGYNDMLEGCKKCSDIGCLRIENNIQSGTHQETCRAVHAEQSVLMYCARHGVSANGATMYVTTLPCSVCTKLIIEAGIKRVVYSEGYPDNLSMELFKESKVELVKL